MRSALLSACVLLFLLVFPSSIFATISVSVSTVPVSINQEQEIEVNILLTCTNCSSDSYLRGVFYPSGTSYYGFTQNKEGVWTNASGGNCLEYYKVFSSELVEGSWSGKLKVKPDLTSSYHSGPGEYFFKVGRYTNSCSSPTWSQESNITIYGPTNTPMPTNTSAPVPTSTRAPSPTTTPTVRVTLSTPTLIPTQKETSVPTVRQETVSISVTDVPAILGSEDKSRISSESANTEKMKSFIIALLFVSAGLSLFAVAGVLSKVNLWKVKDKKEY